MTPDELIEKVTDAMLQEDNYYVSRDHARAAIRVVLEEAADAVGEVGDCAEAGAYINAIRALMPKE